MRSIKELASDARQTNEWGDFLLFHKWETVVIDGVVIFVRELPLLHRTFLKIQHPNGPIPFEKIEKLAQKKKALFIVIEPSYNNYAHKAYVKHGYLYSRLRFAHSATILLDMRLSAPELLATFSQNTRRNIKKAQSKLLVREVVIAQKHDEEILREFYELYAGVGKIKHFYVPSYAETKAKILAFRKTSTLLFAYEKQETKKPVAVLWTGSVDKTLIYFHPGNTELGYTLLANYVLIWEALQRGKKKGLAVFDFETAYDDRYPKENEKWKGYTEFKKKFGGEFVQYPQSFIKFYNPLIELIYKIGTIFSK